MDTQYTLEERHQEAIPLAHTYRAGSAHPCGGKSGVHALAVLAFSLLVGAFTAFGQTGPQQATAASLNNGGSLKTNSGWSHLKYAIYFTSPDIEKLLVDSSSFRETMEYLAPVKAQKVYLEWSNSGSVSSATLTMVADRFRALGMRVVGGMVPVGPRGPMCYNDPEHLALLEQRAKALAEIFDEFIIDDWLFTICTCEKCVAERGKSSWADYRTKLLLEKSKKYIIDPAKRVRPGIKIIIKYPNWYEGHRENGYDVYAETRQFDAMAVGIETRTRAWHDQHIPMYSGYIFQRWWSSVDPGKWVGSWLDNYDMKGEKNDYVAQVWQAVLATTPEIILWSGGHLHHTGPFSDVYPHFRETLPEFDRVAGLLSGLPKGVPIYLPYGSSGEYNIFGYLGMAGIPLDPVAQFPTEARQAIFTRHSLRDPGLADKMLARLRSGRDVFMTWQLFGELQNSEFRNTLNLLNCQGSVSSSMFRMREGWHQEIENTDKPFVFPRIETTTWPYVRDVAVVREDYDFGVLLRVPYLNGTLYILNMPENSYDLLRLPQKALNMIRRAFGMELGVQLLGPGGVSMYLFGSRQCVLYNISEEAAPVSLRFSQQVSITGWSELVRGQTLTARQDTTFVRWGGPVLTDVSLTLQPFEIAVVQAP